MLCSTADNVNGNKESSSHEWLPEPLSLQRSLQQTTLGTGTENKEEKGSWNYCVSPYDLCIKCCDFAFVIVSNSVTFKFMISILEQL